MNLALQVWDANVGDTRRIEFDLCEQTRVRFDQEGVKRPSPYQAVVLKKEEQRRT
jgi:hypothetical protein